MCLFCPPKTQFGFDIIAKSTYKIAYYKYYIDLKQGQAQWVFEQRLKNSDLDQGTMQNVNKKQNANICKCHKTMFYLKQNIENMPIF